VTFNETNWYQWQDVYVLPVTGDGFDGQDFKCFAVQPSLVQGIQGMHNACLACGTDSSPTGGCV
jgi:hypothetical protein